MEPQAEPTQTPPPPSMPSHPIGKKNGAFSMLGKIFLVLIVVGGLLLGGYYLGQTSQKTQTPPVSPTLYLTQSPISPTSPIAPTTSSKKTKTVKAGLTDSAAFKPYSVEVPDGWTDVRENTQAAGIDKLTLSKNGYTLTIYQAAMGGGGCLYPGDPPFAMAQTYTDFAEITGTTEKFRRSWNQSAAKTTSYTVCYKGTDDSYGTISSYGAISAVSPNPADSTILAEIDSMIASLAKQ